MGCINEKTKRTHQPHSKSMTLTSKQHSYPRSSSSSLRFSPTQRLPPARGSQSSFISCKICLLPFDQTVRIPMSLPCYHTFCKECISKIKKCPLDQQPFNDYGKNFEVADLISSIKMMAEQEPEEVQGLEETIKPTVKVKEQSGTLAIQDIHLQMSGILPRKRSKFVCEKGHELTWIKEKSVCSVCSQIYSCLNCAQCMYNRCLNCAHYEHSKDICPSRHSTRWHSLRSECAKCLGFNRGWLCLHHTYKLCDQCANTRFFYLSCPNGHNTEWTPHQTICCKCQNQTSGWACKRCDFHMCDGCSGQEFSTKRCPNGHEMGNYQEERMCVGCRQVKGKGVGCGRCGCNLCPECVGRMGKDQHFT